MRKVKAEWIASLNVVCPNCGTIDLIDYQYVPDYQHYFGYPCSITASTEECAFRCIACHELFAITGATFNNSDDILTSKVYGGNQ